MKKRLLSLLLAGAMAAALCACGSSEETTDATESIAETTDGSELAASETAEAVASSIVYDGPASCTMELNYEEVVKDLPAYTGLALTVDKSYEVTDEAKNDYLYSLLTYYDVDAYSEVTDRDTIQEGDYVNVDYTGYKDGEAFDGGSATNQIIDVSGNCSATGSGYIDGFTDALMGAKVGDTVSGDVTFPENYGSEELAGQPATFEFVINSIVIPVTFDTLTDEMVGQAFEGYTAEALKTYITSYLENQASNAAVSAAQDYILANSTLEVPEEYDTARMYEYARMIEMMYCEDTNLETYLTDNYNETLDEFYEGLKENVEEQTRLDILFIRIAQLEGIEIDEEEYETFLDYCLTSYYVTNSGNQLFADADELYAYFGDGDAEVGHTYMNNQYLMNKAVDLVADSALVTYE